MKALYVYRKYDWLDRKAPVGMYGGRELGRYRCIATATGFSVSADDQSTVPSQWIQQTREELLKDFTDIDGNDLKLD